MRCKYCKTLVKTGKEFCPGCGAPYEFDQRESSRNIKLLHEVYVQLHRRSHAGSDYFMPSAWDENNFKKELDGLLTVLTNKLLEHLLVTAREHAWFRMSDGYFHCNDEDLVRKIKDASFSLNFYESDVMMVTINETVLVIDKTGEFERSIR